MADSKERIELTVDQLRNVVITDGTTETTTQKKSTGKTHNLTLDWTGVTGDYILYALTDHAKTLRINRKIDEAAEMRDHKWHSVNRATGRISQKPVSDDIRKNAERFLKSDVNVSVKEDIVDVQKGVVSEEKVMSDLQKAVKKLMSLGYTKEQAIQKVTSELDE